MIGGPISKMTYDVNEIVRERACMEYNFIDDIKIQTIKYIQLALNKCLFKIILVIAKLS